MWHARRDTLEAAEAHAAEVERAKREGDWLRHAVGELDKLAPQPGEETALADRRTTMMQSEKVAEDLREAHDVLAGSNSSVPALAAAIRRLERRSAQAPQLVEPAVKSLDAALNALEETRAHLEAALRAADYDPAELERIEERLFALRAAGRKYNVPVDDLAALAQRYRDDIALIDAGEDKLKALEAAAAAGRRRIPQGGRGAVEGAAQGRHRARQVGQCRAQAAQARARPLHHRDRQRRRGCRTERHRPRRVLGADQSRHQARAA